MNSNGIDPVQNTQLGACTYLLHVLLREAEQRQSGFVRATKPGTPRPLMSVPATRSCGCSDDCCS